MLKLFDKYGKAFRQLSNNYFPIGFICNVRKNINKKNGCWSSPKNRNDNQQPLFYQKVLLNTSSVIYLTNTFTFFVPESPCSTTK